MIKHESGKSLKSVYGASLLMSSTLQKGTNSLNLKKEFDSQSEVSKKRSKRGAKGSFVDQILQAAQETQDNELKDFFLTHVQTESVLPPIKLDDNKEYRNLMQRQKQVSYLVAKHVRLASERQKYGKVENNHYAHYEKLGPLESIIQKVKPSEKTMNYVPKLDITQKPSLELMKTVNKKLMQEQEDNGGDQFTKEFIEDTYQTFGMNQEDIEDVQAIVAEEGDKIDYDSKEIKFTEHQHEFRTICSKVNKEKSAEIFIKSNKDFSKWNLRDKNSQSYFLSRVAMKEPRNFIEQEIDQKKMDNDEFLFRQKPAPSKMDNLDNQEETSEEENSDEENKLGVNTELTKIPKDQAWTESYQYYSETDRQSLRDADNNPMLIVQDHIIFDDMNIPIVKEKRLRFESLSEEEDKKLEEEKKKEEEELKKFIFLEKLKYEKAIKGYDRVPGLRSNIDDFTEVLMQKLFKKREPTNEFKFILKKDNTHNRIDHSKPLYLDDLKRFGKLKEIGDRKQLSLIEHDVKDLKRDFKDENIFNVDLDQQQMMQTLASTYDKELNKQQKQLKLITMRQGGGTTKDQEKKNFSGAWYLPVSKWGNNQKYSYEQRQIITQEKSDAPQIGSLTKQALSYLLTPYTQTAAKRIKLFNKDDEALDYLLRDSLNCPIYLKHYSKQNIEHATKIKTVKTIEDDEDVLLLIIPNEQDKQLFNSLKSFILPGEMRLSLIEWLLEQYEPGIMTSDEFRGSKYTTKVEQIESILRQIGIVNYSDKQGATQNILDKSIEGLNGTIDSIELLVRIATFVLNSQQIENIDIKQLNFMQDKLMNHISVNQSQVFQPTVRLFPPGFPKSEEDEYNLDQLDMIVDDLMFKVEKTQEKNKELNAQTMRQNQDQINLASQKDLDELKLQLEDLKESILKFNDDFEETMKRDLSRLAQNQVQTQLGQIVDKALLNQQSFSNMTDKFQDVVEALGKIQIRIQMIGLNESNNYKRDQQQINNEKVLELVNQSVQKSQSQQRKNWIPKPNERNSRKKYKVEYDPYSDVFIDEEHNKYAEALFQQFHINLVTLKYSDRDRGEIASQLKRIPQNIKNKPKHLKIMVDETYKYAERICRISSNIKTCNISLLKGDKPNSGVGYLDFENSNQYFLIPYKGYYQNPGLIQYSFVVRKYSHLLGGLFKPFKFMEFGYKWNYDRYDSKYYFIKEFKPFSQFKIKTQWQYSTNYRTVDTNAHENLYKTSLKFLYNLDKYHQSSKLFRHSAIHDPDQYAYLKFSSKTRSNRVNTNHSSRLLMENALGGDTMHSAKFGLRFNLPIDASELSNNLCIRASTEVDTNHEDIKYLKAKLFTRYFTSYKKALFQFNLSSGFMRNISDGKRTKINDNFYLKNFKGIRNIGYHYDNTNPNKALSGENLGFDKYVNLNVKILQMDIPLLGNYHIKPFLHTNLALAPNRNIQNQVEPMSAKTFLRDYGRASLGFGLSLQLPSIAIECYFNPLVYRQKNELKADFQVNFGFD
ncbi:UNKNOWN [Stylonychia lemnae]|uniref:Uncharacterized protein n=1 Tax=Stylonychia lemnae TaxID=5949 RepID=A0A078A2T0_STYLE|nr:UNKNOWN [Stylonychia lemnae]|eukprot:CDW76578.1 UNKNOWN [Stylonychia lemnae]